MAKTRSDVARRALSLLGVYSVGQAPPAEDMKVARDALPPLLSRLEERGVVYAPDPDAVDDRYFEGLARILAEIIAPDFGRDTSADTIAYWEQDFAKLRRPMAGLGPAHVTYF